MLQVKLRGKPGGRRMAGRAVGAEQARMNNRLGMTGSALGGRSLIDAILMTVGAGNFGMLSVQFEGG